MLFRWHIVLISCGIVFSLGFALYQIFLGRAEGLERAGIAALFAAGGAGLALYLRHILRHGIGGRDITRRR